MKTPLVLTFLFPLIFSIQRDFFFNFTLAEEGGSKLIPTGITASGAPDNSSYYFGYSNIGGSNSPVLYFVNTGFYVLTGAHNGDKKANRVNQYTIIMDVNFDTNMGTVVSISRFKLNFDSRSLYSTPMFGILTRQRFGRNKIVAWDFTNLSLVDSNCLTRVTL
jgi:hypothetical protein